MDLLSIDCFGNDDLSENYFTVPCLSGNMDKLTVSKCPNSSVIPCQCDLPAEGNNPFIPFRPEESFDTFESLQPPMFSNFPAFPQDNGVSFSLNPCENDNEEELPFMSFLKKPANKAKRLANDEVVKFVCMRSSCKRVSRKCGQLTCQRLRGLTQNHYYDCLPFNNNHFYGF